MATKQNHASYIQVLEHEDTTSPETKRVLLYGWDVDNLQKVRVKVNSSGVVALPTGAATAANQTTAITELNKLVGFEITAYDFIVLTYVAAGNGAGEIETAVFKTGGSGGSTIATLTLAYDASNEISSVTKT